MTQPSSLAIRVHNAIKSMRDDKAFWKSLGLTHQWDVDVRDGNNDRCDGSATVIVHVRATTGHVGSEFEHVFVPRLKDLVPEAVESNVFKIGIGKRIVIEEYLTKNNPLKRKAAGYYTSDTEWTAHVHNGNWSVKREGGPSVDAHGRDGAEKTIARLEAANRAFVKGVRIFEADVPMTSGDGRTGVIIDRQGIFQHIEVWLLKFELICDPW